MNQQLNILTKTIKSPKVHYILFTTILLLCSIVNLSYMHCSILNINNILDYRYNQTSHLFLLIDLATVYTLLLLIKRQIYIYFIPYIIITLIAWINVGYSRYFHTYMPFSLYFATENLNGLTANIIDAINIRDITFIVTSIIVFFSYIFLCKNKQYKHSYISIIMLYTFIFFTSIPVIYHFQKIKNDRSLFEIIFISINNDYYSKPKDSFFNYGFMINSIKYYETKRIRKTMDKTLLPYLKEKQYGETHTSNNHNLILILIESLSSFPIKKSYEENDVTPNINKFIKNPNTVYFPKMKSQAQLGESSDGQFIYLNGILPLKNEVTIYKVANNKLMSLSHLLEKYNSYMTIPTEEDLWSQKTMCNAYGINNLYSLNTIEENEYDNWLNDEQLFKYAASLDTTYTQPFCSIILSSSTHSPWNKRFEPSTIEYPSHYSEELKTYLDNVHYLDKWLGYYIESLKQHKLYDNSIIIITADHKPNIPKLNVKSPQPYNDIPLIIMNINKEDFKTSENTRIYQTSLFPTILDMIGIKSDWRGVGKSLYMPDSIKISDFEKRRSKLEQKISEEIILSDYFKHNKSTK